jgi:putative heme iron utilization protein
MQMDSNTAREQFINDYTMVMDNNFMHYRLAMQMVEENQKSISKISDTLREQYETAISAVIERERKINEVTADLLAEILLGWGSAPFDDLAKHYIGLKTETEVA